MRIDLRIIAAILAAYFVACAVVVVIWQWLNGNLITLDRLIGGMIVTLLFSAPGFVVLRLLLWFSATRHVLWFAAAGAVNGIIAFSLASGGMTPYAIIREMPLYAMIGLAAGAAYWLVERAILGKVLVRRKDVAGERV